MEEDWASARCQPRCWVLSNSDFISSTFRQKPPLWWTCHMAMCYVLGHVLHCSGQRHIQSSSCRRHQAPCGQEHWETPQDQPPTPGWQEPMWKEQGVPSLLESCIPQLLRSRNLLFFSTSVGVRGISLPWADLGMLFHRELFCKERLRVLHGKEARKEWLALWADTFWKSMRGSREKHSASAEVCAGVPWQGSPSHMNCVSSLWGQGSYKYWPRLSGVTVHWDLIIRCLWKVIRRKFVLITGQFVSWI